MEVSAMPHPAPLPGLNVREKRDLLAQALADAVFYRDPPANCTACEAQETQSSRELCTPCEESLARAMAYLELGRELGLDVSA
jgi:hypothetical protein